MPSITQKFCLHSIRACFAQKHQAEEEAEAEDEEDEEDDMNKTTKQKTKKKKEEGRQEADAEGAQPCLLFEQPSCPPSSIACENSRCKAARI